VLALAQEEEEKRKRKRPCRSERARKKAQRLQGEVQQRDHLVNRLVEANQASAYAASLQADLNKDLLSLASSQRQTLPSTRPASIASRPASILLIHTSSAPNSQQSLSTFSSTTFWHYLLWIFFLLCYFFALSLCTFLFCLFYFGFCPTTYRRHHLLRQHTSN